LVKRLLAWTALVIFFLVLVNIFFIQYRVTESLTIFMLYALFFFFLNRQHDKREYNDSDTDKGAPGKTDIPDSSSDISE